MPEGAVRDGDALACGPSELRDMTISRDPGGGRDNLVVRERNAAQRTGLRSCLREETLKARREIKMQFRNSRAMRRLSQDAQDNIGCRTAWMEAQRCWS